MIAYIIFLSKPRTRYFNIVAVASEQVKEFELKRAVLQGMHSLVEKIDR